MGTGVPIFTVEMGIYPSVKMGTPKLVIQGNHIYRNMVTLVPFPCKLGLRLGIPRASVIHAEDVYI